MGQRCASKNVICGFFVLLVMSAGQQPTKIPATLNSSFFTAARQRKLEGLSAPHCWALSRCEAFGYNTFVSRASQLSLLLRNAKKRWNPHHNCTLGMWERERKKDKTTSSWRPFSFRSCCSPVWQSSMLV